MRMAVFTFAVIFASLSRSNCEKLVLNDTTYFTKVSMNVHMHKCLLCYNVEGVMLFKVLLFSEYGYKNQVSCHKMHKMISRHTEVVGA